MYVVQKKMILNLITVLMPAIQVFAQGEKSVSYSFVHTDTTYSFYGNFRVIACAECLLSVCFNFNDIKALAPDAEEVTLVKQENNTNQIKYTFFQFPFYKNESLWNRTLDQKNSRVDFTLISSWNSHAFMPQMLSSTGYYKITPSDKSTLVEYYQECHLTKNQISGLYLYLVEKKAIEFLYLFSRYAESHCHIQKHH